MIDAAIVPLLADLMMGAAYADERLRGKEVHAIRGKLAELLGAERIPVELDGRLAAFDPASFGLERTVAAMPALDEAAGRQVLELVVAVHEADGVLDLDEDAYLVRLATALGLPRSVWADLSLEVESHDAAREPRGPSKPPPVPGA